MLLGTSALIGAGVTLLAMALRPPVLFFPGSVVAGVGFGAGHQGGLRTVLPLAAPHEPAGILSLLLVVSPTLGSSDWCIPVGTWEIELASEDGVYQLVETPLRHAVR